jgi:Cu/Ag efflux protein CusF
MLRRIGALCIALAVVMVPVMTAQRNPAAPGKPTVQVPRVSHATIGTIKQVDVKANTIVVTPIAGTDQSYAFSAKTTVHGLPGATRVPALSKKLGEKVVVYFAVAAEKAEATSIEYLGAVEIQQFEGTVTKVDAKARTLTLQPATGTAEAFVFAPRPALNLKSGIVSIAQFAGLTNAQVTVFYTTRGKEKLVWYLQEAQAPSVS